MRPLGTILPGAMATISVVPNEAHARVRQNNAIIVTPTARRVGDGGISVISSAAGKKMRVRNRAGEPALEETALLFSRRPSLNSSLQVVKLCVATVAVDQLVMRSVLNDATTLEGDNPIAVAHRR